MAPREVAVRTRAPERGRTSPGRSQARERRPAPRKIHLRWTGRIRNLLFWQLFLGAVILVNLYLEVKLVEGGLRIENLKKTLTEERSLHQDLRVAALEWRSPSRIEQLAGQKLKMLEPAGIRYVRMPPPPAPVARVQADAKPQRKNQVTLGQLWAMLAPSREIPK